jgi:hypothetical protein
MRKRGDFLRKYGYDTDESSSRMVQSTTDRIKANRQADEARIRPGNLDVKGQVYLIQENFA